MSRDSSPATFSAEPADSLIQNMWMIFGADDDFAKTAESCGKPGCFSTPIPAGVNDSDCYTFEAFATIVPDIHSNYYHHY
ncbi:MAG TPA: hypothetical protein VGF69_06120 [Thermoanaerobaculia bacterium]|jgi:hypothetical protein